MKLYNVPRRSWIALEGESFFFDHIDGMYSYCKTKDGQVIHLSASSDVTVLVNCDDPEPERQSTTDTQAN